MALLIRSVCALGILCIACFAGSIAGVASTSLPEGALKALATCNWALASNWANRLARTDPETATLYRLAWFQAPDRAPSPSEIQDPDSVWGWKRTETQTLTKTSPGTRSENWPETWNDE